MGSVYFLNLTNGILAIDIVDNPHFIRIQSTACEQKRWAYIIEDLDNDFLLNLAIGNQCIVVDYSARKEVPRALYQGLEWIKYALNREWFNREEKSLVKGNDSTKYFADVYKNLSKNAKNKLKYYRRFLNTEKINLEILSGRTNRDGDYNYMVNKLINSLNK